NPNAADSDGDGLPDGLEDKNKNGVREPTETDPRHWDTDCDGLVDGPDNAGQGWPGEDKNGNGLVDPGETSPVQPDTDADGIPDGTEVGVTDNPNPGHCPGFTPLPPGTSPCAAGAANPGCALGTNPLQPDSDGDGIPDGAEDTDQDGVLDVGELNPRNGTDGTGPAGQVCTVANLRPVQFKETGTADVQVAVGTGYALQEMSVNGQVKGLAGAHAGQAVAFLAFRMQPPPGANPAGDEAAVRALIGGVAALNNNTTTQTFTTWDGAPALQAFYETDGNDTAVGVFTRANALANALVGPGAGVLPPGGPAGPFKLQVQYSHRSANSLAVVLALTPLSNFVEPALFTVSDTAGGSALAQFGDANAVQCETFVPKVAKVDFLFVVDDSCSMTDSQGALAQAAQAMSAKLNNATLDYRIAMVTTSYPGNGLRGFVDSSGIQQFQAWLTQGSGNWVGINGSGSEKCLQAAANAVSVLSAPGANPAFRPDAEVVVILLGDADDQTNNCQSTSCAPTSAQFSQVFNNVPGASVSSYTNRTGKKIPVHGIICPVGQTCNGEPNNNRHGQVVADTGGIRGAINDNASIQNAMGLIVDGTIGAVGYKTLKPPIGASIKVALGAVQNPGACNAADLPRSRVNGFDFDGINRTLSFFGACKPASGSVSAAVSYRYWMDTTPNPDGNPPPCSQDPFYDPADPDKCAGRLACNQATNSCECPTGCGGGTPPAGKVCNSNKYVCDFVCTPDCAGACSGYQQCDVSSCSCQCVQSATCAPGYSFQSGATCGCVCDTASLSCAPAYRPDANACACVCKSDCGGCPTGKTCNTSTCTCESGFN
ncbi:MAG: VWA domain-containing protein, partial [Deltaproteobacteria bacterium]|nr:VWA domain-containing protein [Deltaproteobacteria bacterium]